jgi:hypothetical protein
MTLDIHDVRLPHNKYLHGWMVADPLVKHGYTAEMPKVSGEGHH